MTPQRKMIGKKVSLDQSCRIIERGGVVAIPTETVYGLAGDIRKISAIKQIFQIKKRPLFDPLIVHFANKKQLSEICHIDSFIVEKLSEYFHPGPLSLVLRKKSVISPLITSGLNKVAVRMPNHPLVLKLIEKTNTCLAAPSANLFSKISPTRACHVLESLPIPVLDGGPCDVGIESTIVEVLLEKKILSILRPGIIGVDELQEFLNRRNLSDWVIRRDRLSQSPGQSDRHYQPDIPFILVESHHQNPPTESIEYMIKKHYPSHTPMELKLKNNPFIFSRELYHNLRQLSKNKKSVGYVIKNIKDHQNQKEWGAIWDRLEKASCKTLFAS